MSSTGEAGATEAAGFGFEPEAAEAPAIQKVDSLGNECGALIGRPGGAEPEERKGTHGEHGYRWEPRIDESGETEVIIKFSLSPPATKRDVKVTFTPDSLVVVCHGVERFNNQLGGKIYPDDCTWFLQDNGTELEVSLLSLVSEWADLTKK